MISFEQALDTVIATAETETIDEGVSLENALGRYLLEDIIASISVPDFDNSAMDGYAVNSHDIKLASHYRISQTISAGHSSQPLERQTAARIFTGAMIPDNADAVILQEDSVVDVQTGMVEFTELAKASQHIRPLGQDIAKGACMVKKGTTLTAAHLGLIASVGIDKVVCKKRLRVAFFSTGDELKMPGQALRPGQIYNSNAYALRACIRELGAEPVDMGFCRDDAAATKSMLLAASEQADCVITTGGMSVGDKDYVREQVEAVGEIAFWKLAIKPGKPFAMGRIGRTPFFGLPGNPVSSFVTFHLLVRPWLLKKSGSSAWRHRRFSAMAQFEFSNQGKRLNFLRGNLVVNEKGQLLVSMFSNQSSGVMASIAEANVLVPIKPGNVIAKGDQVEVLVLNDLHLNGDI